MKTDRQVTTIDCSIDFPGSTRGQLIDYQSKTCHRQDTAHWNTFLRVELVRECGLNSYSDSVALEIIRHKKAVNWAWQHKKKSFNTNKYFLPICTRLLCITVRISNFVKSGFQRPRHIIKNANGILINELYSILLGQPWYNDYKFWILSINT